MQWLKKTFFEDVLSEVLSSWCRQKNSSYSRNSFHVFLLVSHTFGWEVWLPWVQFSHGVNNASLGADPWCTGLALFAGMEAAQRIQRSSCLWKAAAELAETALTLPPQLRAAPCSALCVCTWVWKLHPFLLFCLHPGLSTKSLTTNISSSKIDAFRWSVHVGCLGLPLRAWWRTTDRGRRSGNDAGRHARRILH